MKPTMRRRITVSIACLSIFIGSMRYPECRPGAPAPMHISDQSPQIPTSAIQPPVAGLHSGGRGEPRIGEDPFAELDREAGGRAGIDPKDAYPGPPSVKVALSGVRHRLAAESASLKLVAVLLGLSDHVLALRQRLTHPSLRIYRGVCSEGRRQQTTCPAPLGRPGRKPGFQRTTDRLDPRRAIERRPRSVEILSLDRHLEARHRLTLNPEPPTGKRVTRPTVPVKVESIKANETSAPLHLAGSGGSRSVASTSGKGRSGQKNGS